VVWVLTGGGVEVVAEVKVVVIEEGEAKVVALVAERWAVRKRVGARLRVAVVQAPATASQPRKGTAKHGDMSLGRHKPPSAHATTLHLARPRHVSS